MTQCESCRTKKYHNPPKDYGTYDFFIFLRMVFLSIFIPPQIIFLFIYPNFFALNTFAKFVDKENVLNKFVNMREIRNFCMKLSHILTSCYIR